MIRTLLPISALIFCVAGLAFYANHAAPTELRPVVRLADDAEPTIAYGIDRNGCSVRLLRDGEGFKLSAPESDPEAAQEWLNAARVQMLHSSHHTAAALATVTKQ